mmetsp:Transcript_53365/g.141442  ORF Transcript_53365/g.141442 Transcript_53365/m.141442 type:complete len:113 (-) Transcript_53365:259-597(-)
MMNIIQMLLYNVDMWYTEQNLSLEELLQILHTVSFQNEFNTIISQDESVWTRLEEASLNLAGAAEGNISAGHARVAVAEDLGVVGLEGLLGGSAVNVPDVDALERGEPEKKR